MTTKNGKICLIGMGAQTALGKTAAASAAAFRAGIVRIQELSTVRDKLGQPVLVAKAQYLDAAFSSVARMIQLSCAAAREALLPTNQITNMPRNFGVYLGLPSLRPGIGADCLSRVKAELRKSILELMKISDVQIELFPFGHAAGLCALNAATSALAAGQECCLIGGVDSYLEIETLRWLDSGDKLHNASNPWGFVPGEAAGFSLLAKQAWCDRHEIPSLACVRACAIGHEPSHQDTQSVCIGIGLSSVIRQIVAQDNRLRIGSVYCDMNGQPDRADEWGFTTARTHCWESAGMMLHAPAESWGDIGAASGIVSMNLAAIAWQRNYARSPSSLIWCSSETGQRGAVLLEANS